MNSTVLNPCMPTYSMVLPRTNSLLGVPYTAIVVGTRAFCPCPRLYEHHECCCCCCCVGVLSNSGEVFAILVHRLAMGNHFLLVVYTRRFVPSTGFKMQFGYSQHNVTRYLRVLRINTYFHPF